MITVTSKLDKLYFPFVTGSGFFDQTLYTATFDCIVFHTSTPVNNFSTIRKYNASTGDFILASLTQPNFGGSAYLKAGDRIAGYQISDVTLYIVKIE